MICTACHLMRLPFSFVACSGRWRVAKRPGLDAFLKEMCLLYEIVVFTDSMGGLAEEVKGEGRRTWIHRHADRDEDRDRD